MESESARQSSKKTGREPLTPAKQKRLEKMYEHATKRAGASDDFDYMAKLLTDCVNGDPGNVNYVRAYLENLHKKYGNNKKGSKLAQLQEWGSRNALKKAVLQEQWDEVIKYGLKALTANPWDVPTLMSMSTAAAKMGDRDCELFYLKSAFVANPKDPETNRRYATILAEMGMVDQAIVCWHRVEEALPRDAEAMSNISVLTVQRARSRGEYDDDATKQRRVKAEQEEEVSVEQKLRQSLKAEPKNLTHYLELAQICTNDERYSEAEELLSKAYELSDGDPDVHEKWEDAQLRRFRQRIAHAEDPEVKKKLQEEFFQKDLEACQHRVERHPNNLSLKYELGYRYMLTKQYSEAIRELQAAKNDPRRKGVCSLVLGQCFQQIKQYRLAMSNYEAAIKEIPDHETDNRKRALYLAGRLAMSKHVNDMAAAEKHLATLAGLDFNYKDVSALLDKLSGLGDNDGSAAT